MNKQSKGVNIEVHSAHRKPVSRTLVKGTYEMSLKGTHSESTTQQVPKQAFQKSKAQ